MRDKSNERIAKAVMELNEVMAEEGRGFIFCPIVQVGGNHRTLCAVSFHKDTADITKVDLMRWWASLEVLIENFASNLSEEQMKDFKDGFIPFIRMTAEKNFPTVKMLKV